jgi:hypothetical protein
MRLPIWICHDRSLSTLPTRRRTPEHRVGTMRRLDVHSKVFRAPLRRMLTVRGSRTRIECGVGGTPLALSTHASTTAGP